MTGIAGAADHEPPASEGESCFICGGGWRKGASFAARAGACFPTCAKAPRVVQVCSKECATHPLFANPHIYADPHVFSDPRTRFRLTGKMRLALAQTLYEAADVMESREQWDELSASSREFYCCLIDRLFAKLASETVGER